MWEQIYFEFRIENKNLSSFSFLSFLCFFFCYNKMTKTKTKTPPLNLYIQKPQINKNSGLNPLYTFMYIIYIYIYISKFSDHETGPSSKRALMSEKFAVLPKLKTPPLTPSSWSWTSSSSWFLTPNFFKKIKIIFNSLYKIDEMGLCHVELQSFYETVSDIC